jgi:hypothetical protein
VIFFVDPRFSIITSSSSSSSSFYSSSTTASYIYIGIYFCSSVGHVIDIESRVMFRPGLFFIIVIILALIFIAKYLLVYEE